MAGLTELMGHFINNERTGKFTFRYHYFVVIFPNTALTNFMQPLFYLLWEGKGVCTSRTQTIPDWHECAIYSSFC